MIKFILTLILFISLTEATTISTQNDNYPINQSIKVTVTEMIAGDQDWVGIYPAGSNNDWENVVVWKWTGGIESGDISFSGIIKAGSYDVRAFFNNSFNTEASDTFTVTALQAETTITSQKETFNAGEPIIATLSNMSGDNQDWIGIYPSGSNNDWNNVVAWSWTNGIVAGNITLDSVAAGNYEMRAFFNNSFNTEAIDTFTVTAPQAETTISTQKETYNAGESIIATVANMSRNSKDWIGIYPAGSNNDWNNVIAWSWTNGILAGNITLEGIAAGNYEVRAFFNNSFNTEASDTFTVKNVFLEPTIYESAENGISADWDRISGNYNPIRVTRGFNSAGAVKLTTEWISNTVNIAEYHLDLHRNVSQYILDVDIGGVGTSGGRPAGIHSRSPAGSMPHYIIGVKVSTLNGDRTMYWDSWYTHEGFTANRTDYGNGYISLVYPSSLELVRGYGYTNINLWEHHKLDLQAYLEILEPNNQITSVNTFIATGGFLDNITLSSN